MTFSTLPRLAAIALLALGLAACSSGGGGLAPGLAQRMDQPGAQLDKSEALNLINQYRATRGASPLTLDTDLSNSAQTLASNYASSGAAPKKPEGATGIQVSAGYANFADTFSGWRNNSRDADALADPAHGRAGLAVTYAPNSAYGVHWVLLLAPGNQGTATAQ